MLNRLSPRQFFLLDGCGAFLSAAMLGVVLVSLHSRIGIPVSVLYWLAGLALLFAVYSFSCYLRMPKRWQPYLRFIAAVNLLYCCLTLGLLAYWGGSLNWLGRAYFLLEILILITLSYLEWQKSVAE